MECRGIFLVFLLNIHVMTVNSKVIVEASKDTLSIRVGHGIYAKLGKDGIVLDKFQVSQENIIQDKSQDESMNDDDVYVDYGAVEAKELKLKPVTIIVGINDFIKSSFTGQAFYITIFWIMFGILLGQVARDILDQLQPDHDGKQSPTNSCQFCWRKDRSSPPPYQMVEEKVDTA